MEVHRDVETGEVPVPVALIEQTLAGGAEEHTDGGTGPWPYLASGRPPADPTPEDEPPATAAGREGADVKEER
jgi:hypothetical protein